MLTPEMRRDGWRDGHALLHDETRWEDRSLLFGRWLNRPLTAAELVEEDTLAAGLIRVARQEPGLALLLAAVLEVPDDAPVVRALRRLRRDPLADAGLTPREARALQLREAGCSWHQVACRMLCSRDAARDYVIRARAKLAARNRGLDTPERGLPHSHARVMA